MDKKQSCGNNLQQWILHLIYLDNEPFLDKKQLYKNFELNQPEYELNPLLNVPNTLSELKIVHEKVDSM